MGVGEYLAGITPDVRAHPLEPFESPTLTTGHKVGPHRIQGISDEFIPDIVKLDKVAHIIQVHDGDAILMSQKLAGIGLAVGISSGANLLGAIMAQDDLDADAVVVTVFPDSNKKYLSTDLLREEPVREGYLAPQLELTSLNVYKRVCETCCEGPDCPKVDSEDCVRM
jgi:cysteine synthase A